MELRVMSAREVSWERERVGIERQRREQELASRKDAVTKARAEAQSVAEELRMKRESLPTLNTAQSVTGDVDLDLLVRKYEKAVDVLEAAIYSLAEMEGEDE